MLEYNLLGNREGWGRTDTFEWTKTPFREHKIGSKIIISHISVFFAISPHGEQAKGIGFRLVIRFK